MAQCVKSDPDPDSKDPDWKQNLISLAKSDMNAARNEYLFAAPQALTDLLGVAPRDYPLWYNVFDCIVLTAFNLAVLPWLMDRAWYWLAVLSVARIAAVGVPRFVLALHYSAHVSVLTPAWLNNVLIEYVLPPFFGLPPGVYRFHHVVMHHREDNIYPYDLSSTMAYQRDNFPYCFLHYWARFEFGIWVELPYYLFRRRYWRMLLQSVSSITVWAVANYYLYTRVRPALALWLFLVPQFVCSMALMWGNFSQHLFVDPEHFRDDHRLTVNLLATPYNQVSFNDGYHIVHHKYSRLHWSQMPSRFITERELQLHADHDAVCFKGVDWFMLGAHVWFGFWDRLVKQHFVPCSQKQADMSHQQIIKLLKSRLVRIAGAKW